MINLEVTVIQPIQRKRKYTTVFLRRDINKVKIFRCFTCTYPLFQYKGSVAMLVAGNADSNGEDILKAPFIMECKGGSQKWGKCEEWYIIEGYVEQE